MDAPEKEKKASRYSLMTEEQKKRVRESQKKYYEKNKEFIKELQRKYKEKHHEEILEEKRAKYHEDLEYRKQVIKISINARLKKQGLDAPRPRGRPRKQQLIENEEIL